MMNPEIKARWTAWLRTHADKQAIGRLNRVWAAEGAGSSVGFCCLGGLCELAVQDGIIEKELRRGEHGDLGDVVNYGRGSLENRDYSWSATSLPTVVCKWAGLELSDPEVIIKSDVDDGPYKTSLTILNDDLRWNFNQIADIIDEQL